MSSPLTPTANLGVDGGLPITEFFGMPLHPLLVHGAVVLLPLAAIGFLVMFSSAKRSVRYGPAVLFVSTLGAIFAWLSMFSGHDLQNELGLGQRDHFRFGEILPWLGLGLFVATALLLGLDKQGKGKRSGFGTIIAIIGGVVSIATLGLTIYVGHTGAQLVWG